MSNQPRRRPTKSQPENKNSDSRMRVHVGYANHDRAALQDITNGSAQSINSAQAQHPTQSTLTFQGATMPGTSCIQELEAHDAPAHDYANIKENKNQARRDRDQARRCKQTPEEREAINARRRDRYRARQNKQTPEEKEANNACRRE